MVVIQLSEDLCNVAYGADEVFDNKRSLTTRMRRKQSDKNNATIKFYLLKNKEEKNQAAARSSN